MPVSSGVHILVFGPSWIREIGDAIVRAGGGSRNVQILGENDASKRCYCGVRTDGLGVECPCADFATFELGNGMKVTMVVNYGPLQTSDKSDNLRYQLNNMQPSFTHALVMEPHQDCYFNLCNATGPCSGCDMDLNGVYGSGHSALLWQIFSGHFCGAADPFCKLHKNLLHVVPWLVSDEADVAMPLIALRTKQIAEQHACEAKPTTDPSSGHVLETKPAHGHPEVSAAHQCLTICDVTGGIERATCRNGAPFVMANAAISMFLS